jgi:HlyD family secretion protein
MTSSSQPSSQMPNPVASSPTTPLFRQQVLTRLSAPEQLDQLMQVTRPQGWLAIAAMGGLIGLGLLWSVVGQLPITVVGRGVLIYPGTVVNVQAPAGGRVRSLHFKVGETVRRGQLLATLAQPELEKQLQQQRLKLAELQTQAQDVAGLQTQRIALEQRSLDQQQQNLQQRIREAQAFTPLLQAKRSEAFGQQRLSVQQQLQQARTLAPVIAQRLERRQFLQEQGAISGDALLEAQQTYLDSVQRITSLEAQLKELNVQMVETETQYQENLRRIQDLQIQQQTIVNQSVQLSQQNLEANNSRNNQIREVKRTIAQLEVQLAQSSQIISQYNGKIIEVSTAIGQIINPTTGLGSISIDAGNADLVALTYFSVPDGKRMTPGMSVQVTPATVERERFGGIVGSVKQISPFPVTQSGANNQLGNPALVKQLTASEPQIEMVATLTPDASTRSGYRWSSSQGPLLQMTAGTTTTVYVTVEQRAPITFVFPFLRSLMGLGSSRR